MHILPEFVQHFIGSYGEIALFVLLTLGIVGLPIPDETLLTFAGYLAAKGQLNPWLTAPACVLGSISGISMSYVIGRTAGGYLATRFGRYIGITPTRLAKAHAWFERFGKWTLLFGYFIPGVRHLTGYIAGTTQLEYRYFAIFAYIGAAVWTLVFLAIGYFFGEI
jgi:membrane protein DedA with SNARE-associated domain